MAPFLAGRAGVTVLTNAPNVATALAGHAGITVVVLGGVLRPGELFLSGFPGDVPGGAFCVDVDFLGGYGVDPAAGVTAAAVCEAGADRTPLRGADRLVVLADSSKIGRRFPSRRNRRAPGVSCSLCHLLPDRSHQARQPWSVWPGSAARLIA